MVTSTTDIEADTMTSTTTTRTSTALLTDRYELTMLQAAVADGVANHRATFEVFARRLPKGRRYGVVAGLGRLVESVEAFHFTTEQVDELLAAGVVDTATADYLRTFRFTGTIEAYREGEVFFPYSPVLTVDATFGEAVLLETLILSILNHDSAIAAAAARMVHAAAGRPLIEMGSRRTHEQAAVAAARVAHLTGFATTSNLEAGDRYGIPTAGTAAHAFTLAHRSEKDAFASQVAALGTGTTLLVDTYDIEQGIRTAIDVAGPQLGGVRIDSGDPREEATKARALLDSLGATSTRVVITGDMDEYRIADLTGAPVDALGVGTRLVTGSGAPTAEMVYKLVAIADEPGLDAPLRPVAKRSNGKASVGGRKTAYRSVDATGKAVAEHVLVQSLPQAVAVAQPGRTLQVPVIVGGAVVHRPTNEQIRAHHRAAMAELTNLDLDLTAGEPRLTGAPA